MTKKAPTERKKPSAREPHRVRLPGFLIDEDLGLGDAIMSLNAVSKHLAVLERARLIQREPRGRDRICTLDVRALNDATKWIAETRAFWEARLGALEEYVLAQRRSKR